MAISSWPTKIKDPNVLNKLYIEVFSKFNKIRDFLSKISIYLLTISFILLSSLAMFRLPNFDSI
jgi:hypothetical protein